MTIRNPRAAVLLLAASLMLQSCADADLTESAAQESWRASVHDAWAKQDAEFKTSPTSPLAGTSRFEISDEDIVYFAEKDGELGWSPQPGDQSKLSLVFADGGWKWMALSAAATCQRGNESISPGSLLQAGDVLKSGRWSIEVYPSEDQVTALVFDADSPQVREFRRLERFEANTRFAVTARIEKYEVPETIELITGRQKFKQRFKYAVLKFAIDGVELELTAYKYALEGEHSKILFIPFSDKTTGKHSYGGGRYMMVDEPDEGTEIEIDFNLVTNPLCSYAAIYNCIMPPAENRLPIEILAGEKKFH